MRELPLTGGPVSIEGAVGVRVAPDYVRPWRLPPDDLELHDPGLVFSASAPAGVRLRVRTDSSAIALEADHVFPVGIEIDAVPAYDVTVDGGLHASVAAPGAHERIVVDDLPDGEHVVEVWLPVFPGVRLRSLSIDDGASATSAPDERPRWVTYGSSITHCIESHSPSRTWPATAARLLDRHLTCLGYAGMCHLDPLVARMIADLPADHISLKLGINVHNLATLRARTFAPLVHGFLATVRDGHPDVPITVVSPILSPEREQSGRTVLTTPAGDLVIEGDLSLERMREVLADVVEVRRRRGDRNLHYLDGRTLFGEADLADLPDGLHPNGDGYERMGHRFAERTVEAGR
jgi:hypothetical protein